MSLCFVNNFLPEGQAFPEISCKDNMFVPRIHSTTHNNGITSPNMFLTSFLLWIYSGNYTALAVHPRELQWKPLESQPAPQMVHGQ